MCTPQRKTQAGCTLPSWRPPLKLYRSTTLQQLQLGALTTERLDLGATLESLAALLLTLTTTTLKCAIMVELSSTT